MGAIVPLRFCMVTTFYPPYHFGGDGVYVYRLAEALAERGHKVDVLHSVDAYRLQHPSEPEVLFTHHPNVTLHPLASKRPGLSALLAHQIGQPVLYKKQMREVLESSPWDVIHYHNVSLMGAPGVLRLGSGLKLYTAHEYWLVCPTHVLFAFNREACTERRCLACTFHYKRPPQGWRYTRLLEQCLKHVDCLLLPSRFSLDQHRGAGIPSPMVQLPHFVPRPSTGGPEPTEISGRPFFLYVGRLEKLKGVQDLLRLFETYHEADLVVVGGGSYAPILREQARHLPHVRFLGTVHPSSLPLLYRGAIAALVPSVCYETFGLTAAEAMSQGTPAIVRRIGALSEVIEQSEAGFTFDSVEECRDAMERLRTEPGLRAELGRRGRLAGERLWSVDVHLERYLGLIETLREARARGVPASFGAPE